MIKKGGKGFTSPPLYFSVLRYTELYFSARHYTVHYRSVLFCTTLYFTLEDLRLETFASVLLNDTKLSIIFSPCKLSSLIEQSYPVFTIFGQAVSVNVL